MRLGVGIALAMLLTGCSLAIPVGPAPTIPLPKAYVNDIAGLAWSWCWVDACADGTITASAPLVPNPTTIRFGTPTAEAHASVRRARAEGGWTAQDVTVSGGRIGALPPGTWDYLVVTVWFVPKGDAAYAWRLR